MTSSPLFLEAFAALVVLISMALCMMRAVAGPTVFDRILAVNVTGTLTVVLISIYGFLDGRPDFLDIALLYALINFVGTIAVSKFVKFRDLGHPRSGGPDEGDL